MVAKVLVKEFFAFVAKNVEIIAARIANVNIIAVFVDSKRKFVGEEILVTLGAEQVIIFQAVMTNMRGVAGSRNLFARIIFVTVFTEAIMLV